MSRLWRLLLPAPSRLPSRSGRCASGSAHGCPPIACATTGRSSPRRRHRRSGRPQSCPDCSREATACQRRDSLREGGEPSAGGEHATRFQGGGFADAVLAGKQGHAAEAGNRELVDPPESVGHRRTVTHHTTDASSLGLVENHSRSYPTGREPARRPELSWKKHRSYTVCANRWGARQTIRNRISSVARSGQSPHVRTPGPIRARESTSRGRSRKGVSDSPVPENRGAT